MGGAVYQRGGNYAKLFELRRGVQSAYDGGGGGVQSTYGGGGGGGGGGCSPLTTGGRGGGVVQSTYDGGGGGVQSAYDGGGCSPLTTGGGGGKLHSLLKHKEHHGKRVHSAPALSCSTASLTFVRTTELLGLLSMAQHIIIRSLSSGRGGGGGGKSCQGAAFHTRWGGRPPPPKAMLDPGLIMVVAQEGNMVVVH